MTEREILKLLCIISLIECVKEIKIRMQVMRYMNYRTNIAVSNFQNVCALKTHILISLGHEFNLNIK